MVLQRRGKERSMKTGDQVLLLVPTEANKLTMQWKGPFRVVEKRGSVDLLVDLGHAHKLFHVNLLKKYETREDHGEEPNVIAAGAAVEVGSDDAGVELPQLQYVRKEGPQNLRVDDNLSERQRKQVQDLAEEYTDILSDVPGATTEIECRLQVGRGSPLKARQYPLPFAVWKAVKEEVKVMLQMKIIERSDFALNSSMLLVEKPDGTNYFCVDFRELNRNQVSAAERIPRVDCLLAEVGKKKYFSKLDITKKHWQAPLSVESNAMTAFSTPSPLA